MPSQCSGVNSLFVCVCVCVNLCIRIHFKSSLWPSKPETYLLVLEIDYDTKYSGTDSRIWPEEGKAKKVVDKLKKLMRKYMLKKLKWCNLIEFNIIVQSFKY